MCEDESEDDARHTREEEDYRPWPPPAAGATRDSPAATSVEMVRELVRMAFPSPTELVTVDLAGRIIVEVGRALQPDPGRRPRREHRLHLEDTRLQPAGWTRSDHRHGRVHLGSKSGQR